MTRPARTKTKGTQKPVAQTYQPTAEEQEAKLALRERRASRKPAPRLAVASKKGKPEIRIDHPDPALGSLLLAHALGTADFDFLDALLLQVANVGSQGQSPSERDINFLLSVVKGIEPRDEVEAMLAAQMAAVHMATMTFARRLAHVENIPQQDSAERAFNKLARTFAAQMEALKRYRTGGQQKVTVEHVHVHAGGQAIVGQVQHGGGEAHKDG